MDPRHPEQAISRMRELMKQYDRIEADINKATTSAKLAQLEREGGLVVQEICLVAPRIHEAMMQTSRQRRRDLSKGNIYGQMREYAATVEKVEESVEQPVEKPEPTVEKCVNTPSKELEKCDETEVHATLNQAETVIVEPKPRKKSAKKKKTVKKAE
jgi:hypothetical protein